MPIIKSAIKRVRVQARKQKRNTITRDRYKSLIKQMTELIEAKKIAEATKLFPQVQKAIDMAVKKNLMPKNTAARKKSNLAKAISVKAKPAAAKKPAAKKAPAKKATGTK